MLWMGSNFCFPNLLSTYCALSLSGSGFCNKSLQILQLSCARELNFESIQHISDNCSELKELGLDGTDLCENSVKYLVENLTANILKLDLSDQRFVNDEYVNILGEFF